MCKTCRFNRNVHSVYIVIAWELCYLQSIVVKSRCFRYILSSLRNDENRLEM